LTCVEQKICTALVTASVTSCGDIDNAITWINANFSTVSPLSLAWVSHPVGWQYRYDVSFDNPSSTTPNPSETSSYSGLITGGFEYPNGTDWYASSYYGTGHATRIAFQLPDSSAQLVGAWCTDDACAVQIQASCVMTGVKTGCGYVFDIPIPVGSYCNPAYPYPPTYTFYPNYAYGSLFVDYVWSDFVTACTADPAECLASTTPGPCMSGDPFFGDDPP
jgi:hypothetical protein